MDKNDNESRKHAIQKARNFRNVFVFLFFRDFVMEVFDSTLDVDYWIFENNKETTYIQDWTLRLKKRRRIELTDD